MNTTFENVKTLQLIPSAAVTASADSTGVDVSAYSKDAKVVLNIGVVSGTSPTWAGAVQTSPDNSTWTTQGTFSLVAGSASKMAEMRLRVPNNHKYVRISGTIGGSSTPTFNLGASLEVRANRASSSLNSPTPA